MPRRERDYQPIVIEKLEAMFEGIIVRKHDIQQGWPDLILLYGPHWGMLETKRTAPRSPRDFEPNQEWWIEFFNEMSFAACIYPENEEEVLHELSMAFSSRRRRPRHFQSK